MNDYLEITYETGIFGLLLILLLLTYGLYKNRLKDSTETSILIFLGVISMFSSIITNAFFWFAASIAIVKLYDTKSIGTFNKLPILQKLSGGILLVTAIFLMIYATLRINAFYHLKQLNPKTLSQTDIQSTNKRFKIIENNGIAAFWHGLILVDLYKKKPKGLRKMLTGLQKHKTPSNTRKLALYYAFNKQPKKAEQLLKFNVGNQPFRFQPRYDLAKLQIHLKKYSEAKKNLKDLINLPEKIPSPKVDSLKHLASLKLQKLTHIK